MNGEQLNSNVPPQSLKDLILTTYNTYDSNATYANNLISVLYSELIEHRNNFVTS